MTPLWLDPGACPVGWRVAGWGGSDCLRWVDFGSGNWVGRRMKAHRLSQGAVMPAHSMLDISGGLGTTFSCLMFIGRMLPIIDFVNAALIW